MSRSESLKRWQRIADGDLESEQFDGIDLHAWIREVAARMLEADSEEKGMLRQQAIVNAAGLGGKRDGYAELEALADEVIWDFMPDDMTPNDIAHLMYEAAEERGLLKPIYVEDKPKGLKLMRRFVRK